MKTIFVIGGIGAGKSTVSRTLENQGIPLIDLDKVGHEVLTWPIVKADMRAAFGPDIFDKQGEVIRPALAAVAFASEDNAHKLNCISLPRIKQAFAQKLAALEKEGHKFAVVEYSNFEGKESSWASKDDCVIAVTAPEELRVARAVARGGEEQDVRNRIARQVSDEVRIEAANYVFVNDGSAEQLRDQVLSWWSQYSMEEGR